MHKRQHGFTIVELLVVIVVIAILASIAVVAFNGVQARARNSDRAQEATQWQKQFELYRAEFGRLPDMADGFYCLGRGFPIGSGGVRRCRDQWNPPNSHLESDAEALMTELEKSGSIRAPQQPVYQTTGPYARYASSFIQIYHVFEGSSAAACPASMTFNWTNNSTKVICLMTINK